MKIKTTCPLLLVFAVLITTFHCDVALAQFSQSGLPDRKPLSPEEQKAFLAKRTVGGIAGSFDSYCSLLYAVNDVAIHTEDHSVNTAVLDSPFPEFYKPTWAELFDSIAQQTKSTWKYDPARDYWVFTPNLQPMPFEISVVDGWKAHYEGLYVGYKPSIAPVGMDIYFLGRYSVEQKEGDVALFDLVRKETALQFARHFKPDVSIGEMQEVQVGARRALFFETDKPTGVKWRQWVLVDSGMAFAIVSAIEPEHEDQLLPDVLKMVRSFRMLDNVPNYRQ